MWRWPEWVPLPIRESIEKRFSSPQEWQQDAVAASAPLLGDETEFRHWTGKFVHSNGPSGFLVLPENNYTPLTLQAPQVQWRVLSVHQPYATALVSGMKRFETRSRKSKYRGKLIIHATAKAPSPDDLDSFWAATSLCQVSLPDYLHPQVALGRVLGLTEMVDCKKMVDRRGWHYIPPTGSIDHTNGLSEAEELLGNWQEGRFAWEQSSHRALPSPLPWKGKRGMQMPSFELLAQIRKQLEGVTSE